MRALIRFGKQRRVRFISHLDLQRFFQRALNRSGLPIAYTQGFNPHPVMSFGSALALGWTSEYEILDFKLAVPMGKKRTEEALRSALPESFPLYETRMVDDRYPAPMGRVAASDYLITLSETDAEVLGEACETLLASEHFMAMRKTKSGQKEMDIRPCILEMGVKENVLQARLKLTEQESLRPDLLLRSLYALAGREEQRALIHRTSLLGVDESGALVPLMEIK